MIPNYCEVDLGGQVVKVAPLKLNNAENLKLIADIADGLDGAVSTLIFMKRAPECIEALRRSLGENHSADEVEAAVSKLGISLDMNSPYMRCVSAMLGRVDDDKPADDE